MKITKEQKEFIENRKNTFVANDWFDINFFGRFLNSDHPIKKHFNAQTYSISEENISSRVLNHWYEMGIIDDDRLNGKGWKRLSMSEIVWIHIINKLRGFGLDLKRIKEVKSQIDLYSSKDNISKSPLLDFYMAVAITSSIPIKLIVFESGQAEIVRQMEIDLGNEFGWITEDFISIDLNKLLDKLLTKKKVKADYLNYSQIPKSPLVLQIEDALSTEDIQSVTIRVQDKDYVIDEEFFTKDKQKANALMRMLQFGSLTEKKFAGKSTYTVTNKKKIKRDNP